MVSLVGSVLEWPRPTASAQTDFRPGKRPKPFGAKGLAQTDRTDQAFGQLII